MADDAQSKQAGPKDRYGVRATVRHTTFGPVESHKILRVGGHLVHYS